MALHQFRHIRRSALPPPLGIGEPLNFGAGEFGHGSHHGIGRGHRIDLAIYAVQRQQRQKLLDRVTADAGKTEQLLDRRIGRRRRWLLAIGCRLHKFLWLVPLGGLACFLFGDTLDEGLRLLRRRARCFRDCSDQSRSARFTSTSPAALRTEISTSRPPPMSVTAGVPSK